MEEQLDKAISSQLADETAYNNVTLTDKQLEPSKVITSFVSRNQQLGNVDSTEFKHLVFKKDEAMSLLTIPYAIGGWLGVEAGKNMLSQNELTFVMSGSKSGYIREILSTRKAVLRNESQTKKKFGVGIDYE